MGAYCCTACHCCCYAGQIQGRKLCNSRHCSYNSCCHSHGNRCGTNRNTNQRSYNKCYHNHRKRSRSYCISDDLTQSGILKHIAEYTAAGCYKKNQSCRLQRLGHNLFQLFIAVSMSGSQQIHCHNCRNQQSHKRLAQEAQNTGQRSHSRNHTSQGVQNNQYQRNHNNAYNRSKGRQLRLIKICLICYMLRNRNVIFFPAESAKHRACHNHGNRTAQNTY